MPTLRDIIDNRTIIAAAPKASKPSPVAQHIADHVQDPFSATKDGFSDLQQKRNEYDMSREKMQRNLAPVQSVIDHAALMHGLTVGSGMSNPMPGTPPMGTAGVDPNDPNADPNAMQDDPDMGGQGVPQNMGQQPGNKMNQARPSVVGNQPGVAPGPQQSVRPPKLGMAQPGKPKAGIPQPGVNKSNPQNMQYNKQAKPPMGNKSLPGAKGPGDPKNAAKNKKAQDGTTGRQIKVNVSAFAERQESQFGFGMLKAGGVTSSSSSIINAGGPGSGRRPEGGSVKFHGTLVNNGWKYSGTKATDPHDNSFTTSTYTHPKNGSIETYSTGGFQHFHKGGQASNDGGTLKDLTRSRLLHASGLFKKKKMKAGPAQESDKVNDSGSELAYNPVMRSHAMKGCNCAKCKAKMMEAGGPGSGRHPYKLQVSYKGEGERSGEGHRYTRSEMSQGTIAKLEKLIQKAADKHDGKHEEGPSQIIFGNKVYHKLAFHNEEDARNAHQYLKSKGLRGMELDKRWGKKYEMLKSAGSKEGAMKGWGTRGRGNPKGHASEKELKSKRIKIARMRTGTGVGHHRPGKMSHGKGVGMRMPNPAFA